MQYLIKIEKREENEYDIASGITSYNLCGYEPKLQIKKESSHEIQCGIFSGNIAFDRQ